MSAPRRNTLTPTVGYDPRIGRYRDLRTGQLVSQQTVRSALDRVLDTAERDARAITQALRDRTISVADWQREMATNIRRSHAASAALAHGGWANMTPQSWGATGNVVKAQYRYLDRFAAGIADGSIPLDGRVLSRAEQYILSGRIAYETEMRDLMARSGNTECRNVRHARDSCSGCLDNTALGWVAISEMPPIGDAQCRSRCRCTRDYR